MKQEDTKRRILNTALELFAAKGYDSVSVGEIAGAVGIKAPSLYNHFPGKQAIFDAIVESTAAQYEADTGKIDIHVENAARDVPVFAEITAEGLFEKVRQIFEYSLHNQCIRRFRRMMTMEQFRSPELAALYSGRYVDRVLAYHAGIFRALLHLTQKRRAGACRPRPPLQQPAMRPSAGSPLSGFTPQPLASLQLRRGFCQKQLDNLRKEEYSMRY